MHQDQDDITGRRINKEKIIGGGRVVPLQFTSSQSCMPTGNINARHYSQPPVVMIQSAAFGPQQYMAPHVYMPRGLPNHPPMRQPSGGSGKSDIRQPSASAGGDSQASTSEFYYPCLPNGARMYHLPYQPPPFYQPQYGAPPPRFVARNVNIRQMNQPNPASFPQQFPIIGGGKPTNKISANKVKRADSPLDLSIKTGAMKLLEQQLQQQATRNQLLSSSHMRTNEATNTEGNQIKSQQRSGVTSQNFQKSSPSSRLVGNKTNNKQETSSDHMTEHQRSLSSYMNGPNLTSRQVNSLLDDIYMSLPGNNRKVLKVAEPVKVNTSSSLQPPQQVKATNAFQQFCKEQRELIRLQHPYKKVIVNNHALGKKWKELTVEDRQVYCSMAAKINGSVPSRKRRKVQRYQESDWLDNQPKLLPPRCKAASSQIDDEEEEEEEEPVQPSTPDENPDACVDLTSSPTSPTTVSQVLASAREDLEESTLTAVSEEKRADDDDVTPENMAVEEITRKIDDTPPNDVIDCVIISSDEEEEENDDDIGPYPSAYVVDVNNIELEDHPVTIKYRPAIERFSMTDNHVNGDSAVRSFDNISLVGAPMVEIPFHCVQPVTSADEYLVAGNFIQLTNQPMIFCSTHTRREVTVPWWRIKQKLQKSSSAKSDAVKKVMKNSFDNKVAIEEKKIKKYEHDYLDEEYESEDENLSSSSDEYRPNYEDGDSDDSL